MGVETLPSPPSTPPPPAHSLYQDPSIVPVYVENSDDDQLNARIEKAEGLTLPLVRSPNYRAGVPENPNDETRLLEREIVKSFFSAIAAGQDDVIQHFVSRGLVSPDVTSSRGETPLLAAVRTGRTPIVSRLVVLGATVDGYGTVTTATVITDVEMRKTAERTPLQLAAELGNLALVRVLMEDYGADDSLIAPDGAIALRLAVANGHRDVVSYLPVRRAGATLRWKRAMREEWLRAYSALRKIFGVVQIITWRAPLFLFYECPKEIGSAVWKRRHRIANWCKRKVVELPRRVKSAFVKMPGHLKALSKDVWTILKGIPEVLKKLGVKLLKALKAIPGILKKTSLWVLRGARTVVESVFNVVAKLISLLHTAIVALISFFKRITVKDVWDGACYVFRAIFVDAPVAIAKFLASFTKVTHDILVAVLGGLGECLYYTAAGILFILTWIPRKLWECVEAFGRLVGKGWNELMALIDPKRM